MKKMMVIALALGFVLGLSSLASAATATVAGDLRTELSWAWTSKEASPDGKDQVWGIRQFNSGPSSRIGFNYMSDDKKFSAFVQLGLYTNRNRVSSYEVMTTSTNNNLVMLRHAWFKYSWGEGSILFGQTDSIAHETFFTNQYLDGTNASIGYGWNYFGRQEQIRLVLGKQYAFQLAIENPIKGSAWDASKVGYKYNILPAIAMGGMLNFGNVVVHPWARWEWSMGQNINAAGDDDSYHTLDLGLHIKGDFGLVGFLAGGFYGLNSAISLPGYWSSAYTMPKLKSNFKTDDNSNLWGAQIQINVGGLYAGYGHTQANMSGWKEDPKTDMVYVNYMIPFGMITFIPEIEYINRNKTSADVKLGEMVIFGLVAQMKF